MTRTQKITLRMSELKEEIGGLLDLEQRSEEQADELKKKTTELRGLESDYRAAVLVEGIDAEPERRDDLDAEGREKRDLLGKVSLAGYLKGVIDGKPMTGADAEAGAAFGCPGQIPLELFELERRREDTGDGLERRAVTPAPSTTGQTVGVAVPALFDSSIAAYLGLDMPTVPAGTAAYPIVSTSLTGGMKAKGAAADETASAITVSTLKPKRLTGAFRIQREDIAVLPSLETTLRQNLGRVLSDALDNQLLNGDNTGAELNGLLEQLTDPAAPAANVETFARYNVALSSHIDGLHAMTQADIRVLVGPDTLRHMAATFATNDDSMSASDYVTKTYGGVRASRRIPDVESHVQQAVIVRRNPQGDRVAVAPVWSGLELIRDQITGAGTGEIVVTGIVLVGGVVLLRSGVYVQDSFRLSV